MFLFLIMLMYLSKKKYDSLENTIYRFMLILTMSLLFIELFFAISMWKAQSHGMINEVLARMYILGCILWVTCLIVYVWSLGKKGLSKEENKKYKKRIIVILSIVDLLLFISSCLLPVTYYGGNNDMYVIGGGAVYVLYLIGFVMIIVLLFALLNNKTKVTFKQKIPLYFAFILFVSVTAIQWTPGVPPPWLRLMLTVTEPVLNLRCANLGVFFATVRRNAIFSGVIVLSARYSM